MLPGWSQLNLQAIVYMSLPLGSFQLLGEVPLLCPLAPRAYPSLPPPSCPLTCVSAEPDCSLSGPVLCGVLRASPGRCSVHLFLWEDPGDLRGQVIVKNCSLDFFSQGFLGNLNS